MHYLLFYEFVSDYVERRPRFRAQHLKLAWEAQARGELILAGAFADPIDGAALLFRCESRAVPDRFVASDPYVTSGLVKKWTVREWTTVVGDQATTPVRPET
ncbi:MAG TPA: YciI-like protein [Steroidobacteraceae bacterium]